MATTYLDQPTYLAAKSDPNGLKAFVRDWVTKGQRGVMGGDGKPASYWDVYQDMAHSGIDVSDLPAPDTLPGGTVKGGGADAPLQAKTGVNGTPLTGGEAAKFPGYTGSPAQAQAQAAPVMMSQQDYLNSKSNPVALKAFLKDWVKLGGRGVIGGDGQPASYWDVYQDLAASGIDIADLPKPETLAQGSVKGGGATGGLENPATPAAAAPAAQQSPELTDLLKRLGVDYQNAPAPTPGLLAFLRGVGMTLSTAEDTRNTAIQQLGQRATDATTATNTAGQRSKENLTGDLVRRGVLRSGEANTRYTNQSTDLQTKLGDIQRSLAEGTAMSDTQYRNAQDAARQAALEKVIAEEQNQAQTAAGSAAQRDAYDQQQKAADLAYQRQQQATRDYQTWLEEQAKKGVAV